MNKDLGQVFTPKNIVDKMISIITVKDPKILEPASGDGAFYNQLKKKYTNIKAIELDKEVAHKGATIMDFFDYKPKVKFDLIIGNPPYVEFSLIDKSVFPKTNSDLVHKPNLYMYFLEKSMSMLKPNGEIIFIIPTE